MAEELNYYIEAYVNTCEHNDRLFEHFKQETDRIDFLKTHRDHIETHNLGFGERAFPYMWYLLLKHIKNSALKPEFLEIGVFKGQIVSLWTLIGKELNFNINVYGVTPLVGNPLQKSTLLRKIRYRFSKKFKENVDSGNYYENLDYLAIVKRLFAHFGLDFNSFNLIQGYSTDKKIVDDLSKHKFAIIYIDGDHTYKGVINDIKNYAPLIEKGGFLIMDDASYNLPGSKFWKGHKSVSEASKIIDELPFKNILNIGHNRIYQKQ